MPTESIKIVNPDMATGGGDYDSLSAWEAGEQANLVTGDIQATAKCRCTGGTADTTACTVSGWTTDATRYIKIWTDTSETYRHSGGPFPTGNKYRMEVSNAHVLTISADFVTVDGLALAKTSSSVNSQACIRATGLSASNKIIFSNLLCKQAGNATYTENAVLIDDSNAVAYIFNCVAYGMGANTGADNDAYRLRLGTSTIYNCVAIGGRYGIRNVAGTATAKNCYGGNSGAGDYNGTITKTTCASSDTTGSTGLQSIAVNTSNFVNVTAGSENFHLAGTGSALYHTGTDTSGDSAPMNFTTDIDGQNYYDTGGVRSIGADEVVAGSASQSPSASPSLSPSLSPSASPSISPSESPSLSPSASESPSESPSLSPSASESPSLSPSESPSLSPSASLSPSESPSLSPSASESPSLSPSESPSLSPSASESPSLSPSESPSLSPSESPSESPSASPSVAGSASESPSLSPSASPSESPSASPSLSPSASLSPSESPSESPSLSPSESPSASPSESPSLSPSASESPSISPSKSPSASVSPSESPSASPSASASASPSQALQPINPQIALQWSSDGGFTWSSERWRELGKLGEQGKAIYWDRLGRARDRVYRISVIDPVKVTIVDAWIDVTEGTN